MPQFFVPRNARERQAKRAWSSEGKRVLATATIKLLASNHVPPNLRSGEFGIGQHILRPRFGYHRLQYRGHATVYQALVDRSKWCREGLETASRRRGEKWPAGRCLMRSIDLGLPPMLRVNTQFLTFFGRR